MKQLALIFIIAFAVSGCASTRADIPPPQSKPKAVNVVKAKAVTVPVSSTSQPATPATIKKKKPKRWWAPWRK